MVAGSKRTMANVFPLAPSTRVKESGRVRLVQSKSRLCVSVILLWSVGSDVCVSSVISHNRDGRWHRSGRPGVNAYGWKA
jgi:hypothetical protein